MQEVAGLRAELHKANKDLASAISDEEMAEPRARLASEEARVHVEHAAVRLS